MIYFSSTGLKELYNLIQQVKPFLLEADYILISSISNSVCEDGGIEEADYTRLVSIIESYTREGSLGMPPRRLPVSGLSNQVNSHKITETNNIDEIAYISLITLLVFLLSCSGIEISPQVDRTLNRSFEC